MATIKTLHDWPKIADSDVSGEVELWCQKPPFSPGDDVTPSDDRKITLDQIGEAVGGGLAPVYGTVDEFEIDPATLLTKPVALGASFVTLQLPQLSPLHPDNVVAQDGGILVPSKGVYQFQASATLLDASILTGVNVTLQVACGAKVASSNGVVAWNDSTAGGAHPGVPGFSSGSFAGLIEVEDETQPILLQARERVGTPFTTYIASGVLTVEKVANLPTP